MKKRVKDFFIVYNLRKSKCSFYYCAPPLHFWNRIKRVSFLSPIYPLLLSFPNSLPSPCPPESMRLNPLSRSQLAIFILGKCVYISYYLLLPCLFMHWAFVVRAGLHTSYNSHDMVFLTHLDLNNQLYLH